MDLEEFEENDVKFFRLIKNLRENEGNLEEIKKMISEGLDPDKVKTRDWPKSLCTHVVCNNGDLKLLEYFLEVLEMSPEVVDSEGFNCLHVACDSGHVQIVEYLTNKGKCDLTILTGDHKESCLHRASLNEHIECALFLLRTKDGITLLRTKNDDGELPVDVAPKDSEMKKMLEGRMKLIQEKDELTIEKYQQIKNGLEESIKLKEKAQRYIQEIENLKKENLVLKEEQSITNSRFETLKKEGMEQTIRIEKDAKTYREQLENLKKENETLKTIPEQAPVDKNKNNNIIEEEEEEEQEQKKPEVKIENEEIVSQKQISEKDLESEIQRLKEENERNMKAGGNCNVL